MNLTEWKEKCSAAEAEYRDIISNAASSDALEAARVNCLGRKGVLTELLKNLKDFTIEEKKEAGPLGNKIKKDLEDAFYSKKNALESAALNEELAKTNIDLTLPGWPVANGHKHPLTIAMDRMTAILSKLGFVWAEGPQIEEEKYNFDFLNIPLHHPARDVQDTLIIGGGAKKGMVLRSHTSNVQVRYMEKNKPPLRIMSPGKVFRRDDIDASHSPVFHQIEGLYVDKNVSLADLKSDLTAFMKGLFGNKAEVRFRPSFFPFTEPSVEVDVKCVFCDGKSPCSFCKGTGWKEMLGAGIVHPNVLRNVGIDPEIYSGYAFGMGVERLAMLMLGIKDIRAFYENDLRIWKQF
ncbi:Phenylalanyl-tRNA synthetase, alpha subunit [Elusimicrobium minutum Pei191]|uniref:Phenylalanine--tRNA ligase alpha subunit n=1 Tax=Elusimicrobium minutum (strain Pei191) TaxID=445932 RepID=B2KBL6_ELUMP|nr:phenylalanine--tRNA ligase subunit alpha [Elusimicrobium minutum]ACC97703.1 Phenylalanyl-tRNA synthetase, alpha subunit [Elusimicrobium minutum Pei191]